MTVFITNEPTRTLENDKMEDYDRLKEENAKLREQLADCSRSHPHENMTVTCELRTEIARLTNQLAHAEELANANCEQGLRFEAAWHEAEAKLKALSEQEPVGYTSVLGLKWLNEDGWTSIGQKSHTELSIPLYTSSIPPASTPEPCICLTNIFDNDPETGEKKHCPDCGGTGTVQPANVNHLRIEFEEGYPEDVAFGSEQQMLRLQKWLDKFYAQKGRIAELERKLAEQQALLRELPKRIADVVFVTETVEWLAVSRFWLDCAHDGIYTGALAGEELNTLLTQAREECRKERDELAAQVEVMREACQSMSDDGWLCYGVEGMSEPQQNVYAALSITPSAALREIQARTLEDILNKFVWFSSKEGLWLADAIQAMAAAKRKGEPT